MKRIEQLQSLSREHHQSLTLAQKAIKTSDAQDAAAVKKLCREIVYDYPGVWKVHFKIEEDSIFKRYIGSADESIQSGELARLCLSLQQEHRTMDEYYEQMKKGNYEVLKEFGTLLKKHTRTEERQLFPLLEEAMTQDELNRILQTSQDYRSTDSV